jgi:hypothetical protein
MGRPIKNSEPPFGFQEPRTVCLYVGSVTIGKQINSADFGRNGLDHALFIPQGPMIGTDTMAQQVGAKRRAQKCVMQRRKGQKSHDGGVANRLGRGILCIVQAKCEACTD